MTGRATRWAPALQLLLLAGLFAMHGLADHGSEGGSGDPMVMVVSAVTTPAQTVTADVAAPGIAPALGSMAMSAMCVAILVGAALAWLLLRSGRPRPARLAPRLVRGPRPMPRSRAPDPPSLSLLSVCRC